LQRFANAEGPALGAVFVGDNKVLTCYGGSVNLGQFPPERYRLRLWDRETGKEERRFDEQHRVSVTRLAVSADGTRALSGSTINESTVCLWDIATGHCLHVMGGHSQAITALAFTPDGERAISGSGRDGFIRAWDLAKGEQLNVVFKNQSRGLMYLACLSGERLISGGLDGTVRLHDLNTGSQLAQFQADAVPIFDVGVADGGKQILSWSKDGKVRVWGVADQRVLREFATVASNDPRNVVPTAFSADGRRLLIGAPDSTVRLWDVETGQEVQSFPGHKARPRTVSIARDGLYALSGDENGVVILWGLPAPK
jgi:WD40 repeat protein